MTAALSKGQETQIKMRRAPILTAISLTLFTAVASPAAPRRTPPPPANNITAAFVNGGVSVDQLQVFEVGGIVLIRGRAYSKADAERAGAFALSLGYSRIANLIQILEPPDDPAIERAAERELTFYRPLEGCNFTVNSNLGIVRVAGTVQHDMQRDMALQIVRNIEGVREVNAEQLVRRQ